MYATHASVVIVNPAGTSSGPRMRVISATPAPFPPSRSRISREPPAKSYTHLRPATGDALTPGGAICVVITYLPERSCLAHGLEMQPLTESIVFARRRAAVTVAAAQPDA